MSTECRNHVAIGSHHEALMKAVPSTNTFGEPGGMEAGFVAIASDANALAMHRHRAS